MEQHAISRLKARNKKDVPFTRQYFRQLADLVAKTTLALSNFHPAEKEPAQLRLAYMPLYTWLAVQISDLYELEVTPELLHSPAFTKIDLVDGVITVKVDMTYNRVRRTFELTFNDEAAPYFKNWPALLTKNGGNGERFKDLMDCV